MDSRCWGVQSVVMNVRHQLASLPHAIRPVFLVVIALLFLPFPAQASDGAARAERLEYADNSILNILESIGGNFIRRDKGQRREVEYRDGYRRDGDYREDYRNSDRHNSTASDVQYALARRGYYRGQIDGSIGRQSRNAIANYQRDQGLDVTGNINSHLLRALGVR